MKTWMYGAAGRIPHKVSVFAVGFCCLLLMTAGIARAQSAATVDSLQSQIEALQKQVDALRAAQAAQPAPVAAGAPSLAAPAPGGGITLINKTAVKVTLGGFIEAAAMERSLYQGSDINSKWNLGSGGFPLPNSPNYYQNEFRGTARQSRLSLLAQGQDDFAAYAAYFEADFLGGGSGTSGNSQESNSYNPRIRLLYGTYETKSGWHLLAGQEWSLITMNKVGIVPREENIPLTIDAQYVPGFTWTRNPQVRLVKDFGNMVSVGLSVEAPQTIITGGGLASGSGSNYSYKLLNPATNLADVTGTTNNSNMPSSLSLDQYPDVVGKVAFDACFGHYEAYGLARFFSDRTFVNNVRDNNTTVGWGAGGAMLVPVAPKLLDFQGSVLAGQGIGRYGSAGLYDVVVNPITGKLEPLTEVLALAGLIAHPNNRLDIYGYAGIEQASRTSAITYKGTTGGFGSALYAPSGLLMEGNAASGSLVEAAGVQQATIGFWYNFYQGILGKMRVGLSDSYTRLTIFGLPAEKMNTVMVSFRYYPF
jgi:outer membrane murein-binding lipoprotein Lpp